MGWSTKCCSIEDGGIESEVRSRRVGGTTRGELINVGQQGLIIDPESDVSGCGGREKEKSTVL